jgi:homoserine dehydrogenase
MRKEEELRIIVLGLGVVGSALVDELVRLEGKSLGGRFRLYGIQNRRRWIIEPKANWRTIGGMEAYSLDKLKAGMIIDCTSSIEVAMYHQHWLDKGIRIVTANKLALSGPIEGARGLFSSPYYGFSATVGAGCPFIQVLKSMVESGDRIRMVEGILSGTMAFLFNARWNGSRFSDALLEAINGGLTEADPGIDLSGLDVARKAMIINRLLKFDDVELDQIRRPNMMEEDLDEAKGRTQYLARISKEGIEVDIVTIPPDHPFFHLQGCTNAMRIESDRFTEGLMISGPGAGPQSTIHGLLVDIYAISKLQ